MVVKEKEELERQVRIIKALQVMEKELMLPTEVVFPILVQLIKAYDQKWEHIEAEGYRLLVDMIFAQQDEVNMKAVAAGPSSTQFGCEKNGRESSERESNLARRAGRSSHRIRSDDSDVNEDSSLKLVRRTRHSAAKSSTSVACAGKRKASEDESRCVDQATRLSIRSTNQCVELQKGAERQESNPPPTGKSQKGPTVVNEHFQTEQECFEKLAEARKSSSKPIRTQQNKEKIPVSLAAREICKQFLNLSVPKKVPCDLSIVKLENEPTTSMVSHSQRAKESFSITNTLKCLNPEPLQAVAPTAYLLLALPPTDASVEVLTQGSEEIEGGKENAVHAQSLTGARLTCVDSNQELQVKGLQVIARLANPANETAELVETHGGPVLAEPRVKAEDGLEELAGGMVICSTSHQEIPHESESGVEVVKNVKTKFINSRLSNAKGRVIRSKSGNSGSGRERIKISIKKQEPVLDEHIQKYEDKPCPHAASVRHHKHLDISRGKEQTPISLSAPCNEDLPSDFFYINRSIVFKNAQVGISMARIGEDDRCSGCVGNCLDNPIPCECTRSTGGEYAYTVEGSLYPHFLKQELERKGFTLPAFCKPGSCSTEKINQETRKRFVQRRFIKECWEKCGCTQQCGNRVVQRGISHKLQVFWTEIGKGWGVRTLENIPAGSFAFEFVGEILTNDESCRRYTNSPPDEHHISLQLHAGSCSELFLPSKEILCVDATYYGNVARFVNHRCSDNNLLDIPVEIESPDHHYYHVAFFTSRDVCEGEELTWDYALDCSDKNQPNRIFRCLCKSACCRGLKVEAEKNDDW